MTGFMSVLELPPLWREARFPAELAALGRDPVSRGEGVPRGDGEPVLLIPGYLAGDSSLSAMTFWLRRLGYRTSRAGMRLNTDCATAAVERLEARAEELCVRHDRPVAVVGQSRGGTFARALAARRPDLVSGIVCLGAPLIDPLAVHPLVRLNVRVMGMLGALGMPGVFSPDCMDGKCCEELREETARPFPAGVGFISVYSRSDGIVFWESCLEPAAESIEVDASHCGMSVNADVFRVVARALPRFAAASRPVAAAAGRAA